MANKNARKSRKSPAKRGFILNAHKAAIIVGLISLVGVLATSTISNWDKLRGNQATHATPDTTGDLLAYNEQRRVMVEGAFDGALGNLEEAEKAMTGPDAEAIRDFIAFVGEKKALVQSRYDKLLAAIKDKKLIQVEINKTELNTMILETQKGYDELRLTIKTQPADSGVTITNDVETADLRFPWTPVASSKSAPKYILPSITFPMGREPNKSLEFLTPTENACIGKPSRPAGS